MKLLVTGGAGFIGSAVVRQAVAAGHEVVNIDKLTYAANINNVRRVAERASYHFEQADICDAPAMARIFETYQPDGVIHLAAETHVDRSIDGPADFIQTNIVGTYTLLEAARAYRDKASSEQAARFTFLHVSTDEVYGDLSLADPAFCETTPYDPSSPYSAAKAASDHLVRAWGRTYGLPIKITNCSNNYGPFQFPEKLIPVVILKALHGQPIPVYGTGDNIRDWLHVDDHAQALLAVFERGRVGETYNIGGKSERTNLDIVTQICRLADAKIGGGFKHESLIEFVTDRPGHDRRYAINMEKIETELGWTPRMTLEAGLSQTLDWYVDNEDWWRPQIDADKFGQRIGLSTK